VLVLQFRQSAPVTSTCARKVLVGGLKGVKRQGAARDLSLPSAASQWVSLP
jgi:hypothetical protein